SGGGAVDGLARGPRRPGVMGLGNVRIAAGRAVERDEDVLAVVTHRDYGLVVPADVAVGLDRLRPRRAVVRRLREHDVEAVHVDRVDVAVARYDLDDRIELAGPLARAERLRVRPGHAAVGADFE